LHSLHLIVRQLHLYVGSVQIRLRIPHLIRRVTHEICQIIDALGTRLAALGLGVGVRNNITRVVLLKYLRRCLPGVLALIHD
jgi:hypothetical protein